MSARVLASERRQIVIIGGGCIGISAAYFLTRHRLYNPNIRSITVLEAGELAEGSSGKGGGFIADWATPQALAPLSFKLHNDLAAEHDGGTIWGHRNVCAAEISLLGRNPKSTSSDQNGLGGSVPVALDWLLPGSVQEYNEIGMPSNSGQVNPSLYTKALAKLSQEKGATIKTGSCVSGINFSNGGKTVQSVNYIENGESKKIDATDVLIAAGAWSPRIFPRLKLLTPKGHSIIVKPTRALSPYILFPNIKPAPNESFDTLISPDIYPRPGDSLYDFDTVYASGPDEYDDPLPEGTGSVIIEETKVDNVFAAVGSVSHEIREGEIIVKQACFKPQIRKHEEDEEVGPIVGPVDGVKGLWLATGHDEWGIQNSPGTGLLISEMIFEGKALSADADGLDPKHFLGPSTTV